MMDWASIAAGLVILTIGAELLIRGATATARRFGLSELLIGLTLVGFGTSMPELVSSVQAALVGSPGVAIGNVVGSNIANVLLILGAAALIAPIMVEQKSMRRDSIAVMLATLLAIGVSMTGEFSRIAGVIFLIAITLYIVFAYMTEKKKPDAPETKRHEEMAGQLAAKPKSPFLEMALGIAGLGLLIGGAKLLVTGAINVAAAFGVSDTIIGLTIVAIGTSLPELVTSAMAAFRGKSAMALGNVIGSNIYNLLGILGVTAIIKPIAVPEQIIRIDNWVMLAATVTLIWFVRSDRTISRAEGGLLLGGYVAYLAWLVWMAS